MDQETRDEFDRVRSEQKEKIDDLKESMEKGNERIEKALSETNATLKSHMHAFGEHTLQLARENERLKMATEAAHHRMDNQRDVVNHELRRATAAVADDLKGHKEKEFVPAAAALDKHLDAHKTWNRIWMAAAIGLAGLIVKAIWEFITTGRITPKIP